MRSIFNKIVLIAVIAFAMVFTFSCSEDNNGGEKEDYISSYSSSIEQSSSSAVSSYTPANYSNTYRTVSIGNQVWLAENLNIDVPGSRCYGDDLDNCEKYGRLYDWATAMGFESSCDFNYCSSLIEAKHQGICPNGWHIPTYDEWNTLQSYIETDQDCKNHVIHLLATSGWVYTNEEGEVISVNGLDTYGFGALPGGHFYGDFKSVGSYGGWWSATETEGAINAYQRLMFEYYYVWGLLSKNELISVRCVQD